MSTDEKVDPTVPERVPQHGDFAAGERTSNVEETGTDFAAGERTMPVDPNARPDFAAGQRTEPVDPSAHPDFARGQDEEK